MPRYLENIYSLCDARRRENPAGTLTGSFEGIADFQVVFHHRRPLKNAKLFGSSDDGDYYPIRCDVEQTARPAKTWFTSVFTPAESAAKPGTHFLKLELGANTANWNPQLSRVSIT